MSEEEIIKEIQEELKGAEYEGRKNNRVVILIQGLLDLYNKEKEKNEELEMKLLEKELHIDGLKEDRRIAIEEIQEQYFISKDKIKEKIEELDKIIFLKRKSQIKYSTIDELIYDKQIEVLQELLEGE